VAERDALTALLARDHQEVARDMVNGNPWLCQQVNVEWASWSSEFLKSRGMARAGLFLVGSAAFGFSLDPEKAGRPFRRIGGMSRPSDLDLAVTDERLFKECWQDLVADERGMPVPRRDSRHRAGVYWGRIDGWGLPGRAGSNAQVRALLDAVRRSKEFRGYRVSLRIYRRQEDLHHYLVHMLNALEREIQ